MAITLSFLGLLLGDTRTPGSSALEVSLKMIVVGVGLGPVVSLDVLAGQNALPGEQTGVDTSSVTFFQQLGSTVGLTVLGSVFAASLTANLRPTSGTALAPPAAIVQPQAEHPTERQVAAAPVPVDRVAYTRAIRTIFRLTVWILVLSTLVTAFPPSLPLRRAEDRTKACGIREAAKQRGNAGGTRSLV